MKLSKTTLLVDAGIYLVVLAGLFVFDRMLKLGEFSGLVFALWSTYWSVLYTASNIVLAFVWRKTHPKRMATALLLAGIVFVLTGSIVVFSELVT